MNIRTAVVTFCLMLLVCWCNEPARNEIPMYGGIPGNPGEIEADNKFIEEVTKDQNREEASMEASMFGWKYYQKNDLSTAMKRFNQAWLLDVENPDAYWGFGLILAKQYVKNADAKKLDESIEMLERAAYFAPDNDKKLRAVNLPPQHARILTDLGNSYTSKGYFEKYNLHKTGEPYFAKANTLYNQAMRMDPTIKFLYFNLAENLHYQGKNKEALDIIEKAGKRNIEVPKDLVKKIKRELR